MEEKENYNLSTFARGVGEFFSRGAEQYHNNEYYSKILARFGLLFTASLELINALENDIYNTLKWGVLALPYGIMILINFIRERQGYYNDSQNQQDNIH